jgi:hypothetical protein
MKAFTPFGCYVKPLMEVAITILEKDSEKVAFMEKVWVRGPPVMVPLAVTFMLTLPWTMLLRRMPEFFANQKSADMVMSLVRVLLTVIVTVCHSIVRVAVS